MFAEITRRFVVRYTSAAQLPQLKKLTAGVGGLLALTVTVRLLLEIGFKPAQAMAFPVMALLAAAVVALGSTSK